VFKKIALVIVLIALVFIVSYFYSNYYKIMPDEFYGMLQVHYVDVGQGDSTLVVDPSGDTLLIDAGTSYNSASLLKYLSALKINEIDYFIITHYHDDHMGGADEVIDALNVKNMIIPDVTLDSSAYKKLMKSIYEEEAAIYYAAPGDVYEIGQTDITLLAPLEITDNGKNNDSIIIRVDYGESSFLFTGDAEAKAERAALKNMGVDAFDTDVLQAGHHGSRTSSSDEFLDAVSPMCVIISCGADNDYGHPHSETLDKYAERDISVYRTDLEDDILILSDGNTVSKWNGKLEQPYYRFKQWVFDKLNLKKAS